MLSQIAACGPYAKFEILPQPQCARRLYSPPDTVLAIAHMPLHTLHPGGRGPRLKVTDGLACDMMVRVRGESHTALDY